jgi:LPS export ABC transporter protein LptC
MNRKPVKPLGVLLGVLLVAGLIWQLTKPETTRPRPQAAQQQLPFGEMADFVYARTKAGELQYQVEAAQASYFLDRNEATFTKVRGLAVEDGSRITFTGDGGRVDLEKRVGVVQGNIEGRTDDGIVLRTDELHFDAAAQTAWTERPVQLTGPTFSVAGVGMELDLVAEKVELKSEVKTKLWSVN